MKARIPTTKAEKQEFNDYIKRNFNLYAERIFQCWAMAMNDAGDSSEKVSETAKKSLQAYDRDCRKAYQLERYARHAER